LSEVSKIPEAELQVKPYFAVTFDDGLVNLGNAVPVCHQYGIFPAIFLVNDFSSQKVVNYRILLQMLLQDVRHDRIREIIGEYLQLQLVPGTDLAVLTKTNYVYGKTETALLAAWDELMAETQSKIYLSWDELRKFADGGWECGNHCTSHPVLAKLSYEQQKNEIEQNQSAIESAGLVCLPWLAYPYGNSYNVNTDTSRWLDENPEYQGLFSRGGINLGKSRKSWLRMDVSNWSPEKMQDLTRMTYEEIRNRFR